MKILINTPRLIPHGGVANHYLGLREYWTQEVIYNPIGKIGNKQGSGKYRLPIDIFNFIIKIVKFNPDIILLNPSLSKSAVVRDLIFLRVSKLMRRKVAVFFHGFDKQSQNNIDLKLLVKHLNQAECIFVLANEFAEIIRSWGVTRPIHITTTKVCDSLVDSYDIQQRDGKVKNILFLARITENKGILIALEAFKLIQETFSHITLTVVGDGPTLQKAKELCIAQEIKNVHFTGALQGSDIATAYQQADLYLFPTFHAEGLPTSLLEAMAFGLPVISRPVGGVCDFFDSNKMGTLIDSLLPQDFADAIVPYINNPQLTLETSIFNYNYARKRFMASKVALDLESKLNKYI